MYSVGIAALELATGEAPFAGLPVTEVYKVHVQYICIYVHGAYFFNLYPALLLFAIPVWRTYNADNIMSSSLIVDGCISMKHIFLTRGWPELESGKSNDLQWLG